MSLYVLSLVDFNRNFITVEKKFKLMVSYIPKFSRGDYL